MRFLRNFRSRDDHDQDQGRRIPSHFPATLLMVTGVAGAASAGPIPPEVISAGKEMRLGWCTAEIEWSVTDHRTSSVTQYFTTRNAGDDAIWIRRGDETGRQYADDMRPSGRAEDDIHTYSERRVLLRDGVQYAYTEHSATAKMADPGDSRNRQPYVDIHTLGFWPSPTHMTSWDAIAWGDLGPYTVDQDANDRVIVRAFPRDGVVYQWVLDPALGHQPVECAYIREGEVLQECSLTYESHERAYPLACGVSGKRRALPDDLDPVGPV